MTECTICDRGFRNERGMKVHRAKSHDVYVEDVGDFDCPTCGNSFETERGRNTHHGRVHGESLVYVEKECIVCGDEFIAHVDGKSHCSKDCANQSISKSLMGENNPNYDKDRPEVIEAMNEGKEEWLSSMSEEEYDEYREKLSQVISEWWEDDTNNHELRNERLSDSLKEHWNRTDFIERGNVPFGKDRFVDELGHYVRSDLEKKVCQKLAENGIDYEYEPYTIETDVGGYIPDVVIDDEVIIEIKGLIKEDDSEKAQYLTQSEQYTFFVYGKELPADRYFWFSELDEMVEVVQ